MIASAVVVVVVVDDDVVVVVVVDGDVVVVAVVDGDVGCEGVRPAVVQVNDNQLTTLPGTQTQFVFLFVLLVLPDVAKEVSVGVTCDR